MTEFELAAAKRDLAAAMARESGNESVWQAGHLASKYARALIARLDASEARAEAAERERDALREALAPFAKIVPSSLYPADGSEGEKYIVLLHDQFTANPFEFTGADLARARALTPPHPR